MSFFTVLSSRFRYSLLALLLPMGVRAQVQCADRLTYQPVNRPNQIEWQKFPAFRLPFTLVYGGPRLGDSLASPLQHGFSHLVRVFPSEYPTKVRPQQRALDWGGFAYGLNQPWETLESPWGNDLPAYRAQWERWLRGASDGVDEQGRYVPHASLITVDIERFLETDQRILRLKADPNTPAPYRQLADAQFLAQYKKDMTALYAEGLAFIRQRANLTHTQLSTYSDVPIRNTFFNVVGNSWADWTTNPVRTSFLTQDPATGRTGGPFYQQLDYLAPSGYYYYDYPSPLAGDYLAYLLFQVEANRAWSDKPVIPYVWMRYHDCCGSHPNFIQPFMAEATAIFPFFSGARGLWLWEIPNLENSRSELYTAYESFIHGLYRLSRFADMFEGDHELVIAKSARDHMDEHSPIWRGVVKNNRILIAAHNPYATDAQRTTIRVRYKSWQQDITLSGREVYLCQYDLSLLGVEPGPSLTNLRVSPIPATREFTVSFEADAGQPTQLRLFDMAGRLRFQQSLPAGTQYVRQPIDTATLPAGVYVLQVANGETSLSKRVLITK